MREWATDTFHEFCSLIFLVYEGWVFQKDCLGGSANEPKGFLGHRPFAAARMA
jgi:hypothetical protein